MSCEKLRQPLLLLEEFSIGAAADDGDDGQKSENCELFRKKFDGLSIEVARVRVGNDSLTLMTCCTTTLLSCTIKFPLLIDVLSAGGNFVGFYRFINMQ
jgi:hypothetical protein